MSSLDLVVLFFTRDKRELLIRYSKRIKDLQNEFGNNTSYYFCLFISMIDLGHIIKKERVL
jgi:hypothetical protein